MASASNSAFQPISEFSSENGGKNAPSFTDQRHAVVETGR